MEFDYQRFGADHGRDARTAHEFQFAFAESPLTSRPGRGGGELWPPRPWAPTRVWTGSNHDVGRFHLLVRQRCPGRSRAALVVLSTLPVALVLYYGDELGMSRRGHPRSRAPGRDDHGPGPPQGRDRCRTPMPWSPDANGGFTSAEARPRRRWAISKAPTSRPRGRSRFCSQFLAPVGCPAPGRAHCRRGQAEPAWPDDQVWAYRVREVTTVVNLSDQEVTRQLPPCSGRTVLAGTGPLRPGADVTAELHLAPWEALVLTALRALKAAGRARVPFRNEKTEVPGRGRGRRPGPGSGTGGRLRRHPHGTGRAHRAFRAGLSRHPARRPGVPGQCPRPAVAGVTNPRVIDVTGFQESVTFVPGLARGLHNRAPVTGSATELLWSSGLLRHQADQELFVLGAYAGGRTGHRGQLKVPATPATVGPFVASSKTVVVAESSTQSLLITAGATGAFNPDSTARPFRPGQLRSTPKRRGPPSKRHPRGGPQARRRRIRLKHLVVSAPEQAVPGQAAGAPPREARVSTATGSAGTAKAEPSNMTTNRARVRMCTTVQYSHMCRNLISSAHSSQNTVATPATEPARPRPAHPGEAAFQAHGLHRPSMTTAHTRPAKAWAPRAGASSCWSLPAHS